MDYHNTFAQKQLLDVAKKLHEHIDPLKRTIYAQMEALQHNKK